MRCYFRPFGVLAITLTIAGSGIPAQAQSTAAQGVSPSANAATSGRRKSPEMPAPPLQTAKQSANKQTAAKPSTTAKPTGAGSTKQTAATAQSQKTKAAPSSAAAQRKAAAPTAPATAAATRRPASPSRDAGAVRRAAHSAAAAPSERVSRAAQPPTTQYRSAPTITTTDEQVVPSQYTDHSLGLGANLPLVGGRPQGGWSMASMHVDEVAPIEALPEEDPSPWLDSYMGEFVPMYDYLGGWRPVAGAEVLWVQPHFSDARALLRTTTTQVGATTQAQVQDVDFGPSYDAGFRGYLGLRNGCCGDEIQFGYWNFSGRDQQSGRADTTTDYCDFLCNSTADPGDTIVTDLGLNGNVYDLLFFKPLMTCPMNDCGGCGECDSCSGGCDPCGPCCPPWSVRWMAGLRYADIGHNINSIVATGNGTTVAYAQSNADFQGFGPRIGIEGRRFFGAGRLSAYGRGTGSLLVGNYTQTITNFNSTPFAATTFSEEKVNRVIPVAEIEVGATFQVTRRTFLSGGWMVQSWWDLGLQEIAMGYDDSNILGLDGFFLRAELFF